METQLVEHKKSFGKEVIISLVALADDPQTNLVKLKFIRDGKITFAAELLFGAQGTLAVSHGSTSGAFAECRGAPGFVRIREALSSYTEIGFKIEEIGDFFKAELYQIGSTSSPITPHDTPHVTPHVEKLLLCCEKPAGREQLQEELGIRDRKYFYKTFLKPALKTGLLALTIPEKPRSKLQKYQLTEAGRRWLAVRG